MNVLISIKPKWCELIVSGKKTVEVRKTRPKLEAPFKVYIYCTKSRELFSIGRGIYAKSDTLYRLPTGEIKFGDGFELMGDWSGQYDESNFLNGKVIGEFVCDEITPLFNVATTSWNLLAGNVHEYAKSLVRMARLTEEEMHSYAKRKNCYAWRIFDLVIYDKPRELFEFITPSKIGCCNEGKCIGCKYFDRGNGYNVEDDCNAKFSTDEFKPLRTSPHSWCYVESAADVI